MVTLYSPEKVFHVVREKGRETWWSLWYSGSIAFNDPKSVLRFDTKNFSSQVLELQDQHVSS